MKSCPKCQRSYPNTQRFCLDDDTLLALKDPYHLVGRTIEAKYRIDELVGVGGMGAVYKAYHLGIDRRVAFKILLPHLALNNEQVVSLFEREAKTAAKLAHENIATVFDAGRTADDIAYIVMEWLDGRTLEAEIALRGPLSLARTTEILQQVCAALDAAHGKQIIHRDLKPANVMLVRASGGREQVKVLDFGLAKVVSETTDSPVSAMMGTPQYASPEQFQIGAAIDKRTDIYSLGVLLYEMLTKALPFNANSIQELIKMQMTAPPPPIRALRPELPVAIEQVITRMMAKNPEERPPRAGEVVDLFERAINSSAEPRAELEDAKTLSLNNEPTVMSSEQAATVRVGETAAQAGKLETAHVTSGAAGLTGKSKRRKPVIVLALTAFIIAASALAYFAYYARSRTGAINSIAVLPFVNGSGDQNLEYLSDGLSENLIDRLSQLPQLKVIARTSSFKFKGKEVEPQEVANALGVQALVTGRVVQRGDSLMVRAELVDAREKRQMWGEQYSRKAADIQAVQEQMALAISEKLRLKLTGEQEQQLVKRPTQNLEAYQLYLNGLLYLRKGGMKDVQKALDHFNRAVALDPNFAEAWVMVATSYSGLLGFVLDLKEAPKQRAAVAKALELDDTLAAAHAEMAVLKMVDWDWAGAEQSCKRAIELEPNLASVHSTYALNLSIVGRHTEALAEIKRARELDPLAVNMQASEGYILFMARRFDEAIAQGQQVISLEPDNAMAQVLIATSYEAKGMYAGQLAPIRKRLQAMESGCRPS